MHGNVKIDDDNTADKHSECERGREAGEESERNGDDAEEWHDGRMYRADESHDDGYCFEIGVFSMGCLVLLIAWYWVLLMKRDGVVEDEKEMQNAK